ncbi:hypothetical protein O181_013405, partial [Austropuccinia psidii MF-1]|nr:hypothetical protein [Austropuccinia psidii MF-1]
RLYQFCDHWFWLLILIVAIMPLFESSLLWKIPFAVAVMDESSSNSSEICLAVSKFYAPRALWNTFREMDNVFIAIQFFRSFSW